MDPYKPDVKEKFSFRPGYMLFIGPHGKGDDTGSENLT